MPASSVSATSVVYFITGANRGLGYAVTESLAKRPNSVIYAGARDPHAAKQLNELAAKNNNVHVVKLSVDSDADHQAAAAQVEAEAGRVDVLLGNAGLGNKEAYLPSKSLSVDQLRQHFEVNTVGPVRLFNNFYPLLSRSSDPRFVVLSTILGSIGFQHNLPAFPVSIYGSSKAAINFILQRVHIENPEITTFPIHPGWVQTDMGNAGANVAGMKQAPLTIEQSVTSIVKIIDGAKRSTHSGKFWNVEDGKELPW